MLIVFPAHCLYGNLWQKYGFSCRVSVPICLVLTLVAAKAVDGEVFERLHANLLVLAQVANSALYSQEIVADRGQ